MSSRSSRNDCSAESEPTADADALASPTAQRDVLLELALQRLGEIAPVERPRDLLQLLPEHAGSTAREILLEMIKLDLSVALERGNSRRIEDYADALPEYFPRHEIPFDLVLEEMQLRREQHEQPSPAEYQARFPHCARLLDPIEAGGAAAPDPRREVPEELDVGSRLDDFLIIRSLGCGAFARVYLAKQISMLRLVALKISCGTGTESQTLAQLDHPNIVRVFDQRILPERALHLLYMQYLPGGTLSDVVRTIRDVAPEQRAGDLYLQAVDRNLLGAAQEVPERSSVRQWLLEAPWPVVVAWVGVQLARALEAAHRRNVLHRDVKPANVLLTSEGIPKLADFNVSFATLGADIRQSNIGGSLAYMAPEHLQAMWDGDNASADRVRESADLYSLGVLLWELWQGQRPYEAPGGPAAWPDVVHAQLAARTQPPAALSRIGGGSDRVLEQTLRRTLSPEANKRPASGAELAARLRVALHPEVAGLFDPHERSLTARLRKVSPWVTAAAVILLPNIAAGAFNYFYNWAEIITKWRGTERAEIVSGFWALATGVNLVAYPLGAALMIWFTRPLSSAFAAAKRGEAVSASALQGTMRLGTRAAGIGGALWGVASVVYPLALSLMYPWFPSDDAVHFCISLVICGGIAAVYPYFGMTLLVTRIYYPHVLRKSMQDADFERRRQRIAQRSASFLLAAAGIPLVALALLLAVEELARWVMAWAVAATALGLVAAFRAFLFIQKDWGLMAYVLSSSKSVAD